MDMNVLTTYVQDTTHVGAPQSPNKKNMKSCTTVFGYRCGARNDTALTTDCKALEGHHRMLSAFARICAHVRLALCAGLADATAEL
jgi:hypothetical protein